MKMRTRLLIGYLAVFALMIAIAGITYKSTTLLIETEDWVDHSHDVQILAHRATCELLEMQSAARGYGLTGLGTLEEEYEAAKKRYESETAELAEMLSDDPAQSASLREIAALALRLQAEVTAPLIEARRNLDNSVPGADMTTIVQLVAGAGETQMHAIEERLRAFEDVEEVLMFERESAADDAASVSLWLVLMGTALAIALGSIAVYLTTRTILRQVGGEPAVIAAVADQIARGNLEVEVEGDPKAGTGIGAAIRQMLASLRENRERTERQDWMKTGLTRLNDVMRGDLELDGLSSGVMSEVAEYIDAQVGALYLAQNGEQSTLTLMASYAYTKRKNLSNEFKSGEGLVGQAALEKQQILLKNVPEDYIKVTSGLGERVPRFIAVTPFVHEDNVKGVLEVGTLSELSDSELEYLSLAMPALAIAVQSAQSRTELGRALQEAQQLSEELQAQQEELRTANEELEEQTQRLQESEGRLQSQQEEMEVTNEELKEKNELLERQKREVEVARRQIQDKAEEVALASKYKSEFLANMSHELRTPLNSLLLLAQNLEDNREGNLTEDQVEAASVIRGSGSELLSLINEVLDLAKIESGRMDLRPAKLLIPDLAAKVEQAFGHMAKEKSLQLEVLVADDAPAEITTDHLRSGQIIRNLVGNALKFTETGGVTVTFGRGTADATLFRSGLEPEQTLAVAVQDTGIGIALEQQRVIFEAFQQADGGTSRQYGGTGLGLSISRELTQLLGGEILLESEPGKGSTFTLYLPLEPVPRASGSPLADPAGPGPGGRQLRPLATGSTQDGRMAPQPAIPDDRETIDDDDTVILIIEDDPVFAKVLLDTCHDRGFKCLTAGSGDAGLALARESLPSGIVLDIRLPGMDGWSVLAALKDNMETRHIPVHVISAEEGGTESLRKGAIGHATKPINREQLDAALVKLEETATEKVKRVLLVEDNPEMRRSVKQLIGNGDVKLDEAATGQEAIEAMRTTQYSCLILDLGLPDMDGGELLARMQAEKMLLPPVIVHTARDLTEREEMDLREHAQSIVIKDVRSQERLLDEASLFLHRVVGKMPEKKKQMIRNLHETDALLQGKRVLLVDDDMRTTFALSRLLTTRGMEPVKAANGMQALELLEEDLDIDIVLMDIMMPLMDGYEAMRRIRAQDRFRKLPIIALTAKAMPEDRQKCIEAGANDYLPKPLDPERLVSMMRVWLYR